MTWKKQHLKKHTLFWQRNYIIINASSVYVLHPIVHWKKVTKYQFAVLRINGSNAIPFGRNRYIITDITGPE